MGEDERLMKYDVKCKKCGVEFKGNPRVDDMCPRCLKATSFILDKKYYKDEVE